ncbi:MAG: family 4 glycosyl hydrolase [Anaerolineae bacterium]
MTESVRVAVLGGSGLATPELAEALQKTPGRTVPIELVLVGRDATKLDKVNAVACSLIGEDPLLRIRCTTDTAGALEGAAYVLNQVRVGGLEARAFDESYPRALGLPGEETVGPGGFANATRTVPAVLEYARLMERVAPQALFLNLANPSSLVQYAVSHYTRVATLGLCDAPISLVAAIAHALNVPPAELVVDYVGMHHFGWVTGLWWRGQDMLPAALALAAEVAKDIDPAIVQAQGAIPGSYFRYVFHPDRMLAKQQGKRTRAEELLEVQSAMLADYDRQRAPGVKPETLAKRGANWYRAIIAPVLAALVEGRYGNGPLSRFVLNVVNGQAVPWLPADAIVEVPCLLEGGLVRPLASRPVGQDVQALLQQNCAYEMLAVQAIVERDRGKALRALLLNPLKLTYDQAAQALEQAWAQQER